MAHRQKIVRHGVLRRTPTSDEEVEDLPIEQEEIGEVDESEDIEEPAEEEPDVSSLKRTIKAAKKISKESKYSDESDDSEVEIVKEKPPMRKKGTNPISDILEYMRVGSIIVIVREDQDSWKVTVTDKKFSGIINPFVASGTKLSGRLYWETVANPDYVVWSKEWNLLTFAEKSNRAKKMGVEWEHSSNPKIEVMLLTDAVRKHLGLNKYKPEFATRSARANIRAR